MRSSGVLVALVCLAATTCSTDGRRATATRLSTIDQRIGGPKALGEVGDYLLENDKIRVIIHGPGPNRANTIFPGSIIDADLQRPQGSSSRGFDQVQEIVPAFVFEVLDPDRFEVTSDGTDGGPAVVTVEGQGGDLLQLIALLNQGILFPGNLRFRIDYMLEPGKSYVTMRTTVTNTSGGLHPFPFIDPPELLRDLGFEFPGLDELALSAPFGNFLIFGDEQKPFMPGLVGFDVRFGITELLRRAPPLPAFPGAVGDFVATAGDGVSYGLTVPSGPTNYVGTYRDDYAAEQPVSDYSLLAPLYFSGTVGVYHTSPPPALEPGESFTFDSYFVVGRGDVASVAEVIYDLHDVPTGALGGRVFDEQTLAPLPRASIVVVDDDGLYVTQIEADEDGEFLGRVPPGSYALRVVSDDRPTSPAVLAEVRAGETTARAIAVPATGRIAVAVTDREGRRIPCKLTLVGQFDESRVGEDPRQFLYDLSIGESMRSTSFDPTRSDYVESTWYAADGLFEHSVRPGTYEAVVSRGMEYEIHRQSVTIRPGGFASLQVSIDRSVDTSGYVAADTHLHALHSPDSSMTLEDRVISIAGEGVEYAAATDHNAFTDYAPVIAQTGLDDWLVSSVGVEVTTFEMGHFNGYPLEHDSSSVRGGDVEWAGFDPGAIFDQIRERGALGPDQTIVQINHPRWDTLGYFNAYNFDQEIGDVVGQAGLRAVFSPFGPEFALELFSWRFDAIEIIGGKRQDLVHNYVVPDPLPPEPIPPIEDIPPPGTVLRDATGSIAWPGALDDWFVLLNQGRRYLGLGTSDSHSRDSEAGFARSLVYLGPGRDVPGAFSEADVIAAMRSGRVVTTTGPMAELFVNDQPMGADVTDTDGNVELRVRAEVPGWMQIDRAVVYANGVVILDRALDPGERAHDFTTTVELGSDSWLVLEVTGPTSLFPVITPEEFRNPTPTEIIGALSANLDLSALDPFGNLRPPEAQIPYPQAITNPIWVDVDGNGSFDPPLETPEALAPSAGSPRAPIDVRQLFEHMAREAR